MNQGTGYQSVKGANTVLVFYEHPLKILNARTITFSYSEGHLVSVPKGQCMDRLSKEYKRDACPWLAGLSTQIYVSFHPCLRS